MYVESNSYRKTVSLHALLTLHTCAQIKYFAHTSVSNFPIRLFLSMQINDKTVIHICSVISVVVITVITTYSCLDSWS